MKKRSISGHSLLVGLLLLVLAAGGQTILPAVNTPVTSASREVAADFYADKTSVMKGDIVKFFNLSTGDPTFYQWNIPGATPRLSYSREPRVQYHTGGVYDVTLFISNLHSRDTLIKHNYITVTDPQAGLPPGWAYSQTITQHAIAVPLVANPRMLELPIDSGDYIGVFYTDDTGALKCGGATCWNGTQSAAVTAQGNHPLTPGKEGFDTGEVFTWKIYSQQRQEDHIAKAQYDQILPMKQFFVPNGLSAVLDLYSGVTYELNIPSGWSAISSPVMPWHSQIQEILAPVIDQVEWLTDGTSVYAPGYNITTLTEWEPIAYLIKMNTAATIPVEGDLLEIPTVTITPGWNLVSVPVSGSVVVTTLLQQHPGKIIVIQEVAGMKVCWPEKNINTLTHLLPGKGYRFFANEGFTISF
jgi:PKD repeat protein